MELSFRKKNKTIIIMVSGEIDHHTSKELRRQTESAYIDMGVKNIIFHFEKVTFMDKDISSERITGHTFAIRNL